MSDHMCTVVSMKTPWEEQQEMAEEDYPDADEAEECWELDGEPDEKDDDG
jgi:hypothetical protein